MSLVQDNNRCKTVSPYTHKLLKWLSHAIWTKVFILIMILLVLMSVTIGYVNYSMAKLTKLDHKYVATKNELIDKNAMHAAIDILNICINPKVSNMSNSQWYCDAATKKYKAILGEKDKPHVNRVIKNKAYEYMLVDFQNEVRRIDYLIKIKKESKPWFDKLKILINILEIFKYGLIMICMPIIFLFVLKKALENKLDAS